MKFTSEKIKSLLALNELAVAEAMNKVRSGESKSYELPNLLNHRAILKDELIRLYEAELQIYKLRKAS